MKNKSFLMIVVLLLSSWMAACQARNLHKSKPDPITFTNLVGSYEQNKLKRLMENAKLSDIELFFRAVNAFNKVQPKEAGLVEGFKPLAESTYDKGKIDISFLNEYPYQEDTNCRLTVFSLMLESISSKGLSNPGNYLMFDIDAIEKDPAYQKLLEKKADFIALFNQISVADVESKDYEKVFISVLKERGLTYSNPKASVISVVLHDSDEKTLFVGHSGILFAEDGRYWFLEKLAKEEPFQLTVLNSKNELRELLQNRYQNWSDSHPPIILENDQALSSGTLQKGV
ncbi:MAG: DUF4300 family protein [Anaerolineaceae bacterium]|nr:DUF4300 family protein [Anaerolineaceae bacterium]